MGFLKGSMYLTEQCFQLYSLVRQMFINVYNNSLRTILHFKFLFDCAADTGCEQQAGQLGANHT